MLLKEAFDKYKKTHKSPPNKPRSPGLRRDGREADRDAKRSLRRDEQHASRSHKRSTSSPKTRESEISKGQNRSSSSTSQPKDGPGSAKRGPGRPRKEENAQSISDRETTPLGPPKQKSQARRSESDVAVASSENETAVKPRRKLISGKEFRGERDLEKQRRASVASTASGTSVKERREGENNVDKLSRKASPSVSRMSKGSVPELDVTSEKNHEREKVRSIKREDSKDRLTAIRGESPVKRPRKSETPPRSGMQEVSTNYDANGGPQKRRKLEGDTNPRTGSQTDAASGSSPDQRASKTKMDTSQEKASTKAPFESKVPDKAMRVSSKRLESPEKSRHSQFNDEVSKRQLAPYSDPTPKLVKVADDELTKEIVVESTAAIASKAEAEREARALRDKEEFEAKQKAELERKAEAERIEQAREARLAREAAAHEEELKRLEEENERKERQRQEDADAHAREQERQRALYLEQEKQRQKDQERRRAQIQEQQRLERARIEEQKNKERLSKLPLLLRWLDGTLAPKTPDVAALFRIIEGFRYDTIKSEATGQPNGREQWMLNTHVAILLGEKDLQLSRCEFLKNISLSCTLLALHSSTRSNGLIVNCRYGLGTHPLVTYYETGGLEDTKWIIFIVRSKPGLLAEAAPRASS